ncbi:hypothetical protein A2W14_06330 [Candidatus Gottesmanbacteria bacterium RBG_16_37_8]|uniref:PIN domain-containing protein n=1 Tax=Candidatus Gottesmanbacteria bacterium RBG_16_37_8 TaxID=1798371 RepID=A0A1F5YP85_9BACT|nr:MAG: hypothetical protein A2W14_06330 [Candidatus Gottesmanbacteria bacterium RBG_16_37_8]
MKSIIPDANVFLRFLLNDIPYQVKKAETVFSKAKNREIAIIVPQIIIFEIQFTLDKYYQFSKSKINDKLKAIISMDYFRIEDRVLFLKALDLWLANNISFPDAFLTYYCEEHHGELFSFDTKLNKLTSLLTSS